MRFVAILIICFYTVVFILAGVGLIALSLKIFQPQDVAVFLTTITTSIHYQLITALCGLLLILISVAFVQLVLGRFQRERNIAFATSSGQVTVSLSAVEDLIKRLTNIIPQIKELRPNVIATKKGILVDLKVILRSEANIPELTSKLQDITRAKIQEVLGIEEEILVRIHVAKIISVEDKDKKRRELIKEEPTIPYGGYGRV